MVDKLAKALDGLKNLQFPSSGNKNISKKEKMLFCILAADVMTSEKFPNLNNLPALIENIINLCDDSDSDVRMVADESLNKIIMSFSESHMPKIQLELHKVIKKNGPPRCLRAALSRFGQLSQYVRPNKGKVHVQMLVPSLIEISKREEEMIHETLASCFENIFRVLGVFIQDSNLKSLIKAFLHNLSSSNPVIQRSSATCIIKLVQYCRKPHIFNSYVLNSLIDCVVPICEENSTDLIVGVLGCLRLLIPNLTSVKRDEGISGSFGLRKKQEESFLSVDRLIQAYELCLHYTKSKDHNVVTAALETLHQILQNPPQQLEFLFLSATGFSRSYIQLSRDTKPWSRCESEMSVTYSLPPVEDSLLDESEISNQFFNISNKQYSSLSSSETAESKEKSSFVVDEMKTIENPFRLKALEKTFGSQTALENDSDTESSIISEINTSPFLLVSKNEEEADYRENDDFIEYSRSDSQDNLYSVEDSEELNNIFNDTDIGSFTDTAIPLIYCVRHLATSFLLDSAQASLKSDKNIRVSIKSLALSCITAVVKLYPVALKKKLLKSETNDSVNSQEISDILLFFDHSDPQIRGSVNTLIGSFIRSSLLECKGLESNFTTDNNHILNLENLIRIILKGCNDKSSLCNRQSLSAIKLFLSIALQTPYNEQVLPLLEHLPTMIHNSYWLVKIKLVEILSDLPYFAIQDIFKSSAYQDEVIDFVFLPLLGDEDSRVRTAAAEALVRMVSMICHNQSPALGYAKSFISNWNKWLREKLSSEHNIKPCMPFSLVFADPEELGYSSGIEYYLSKIVVKLTTLLIIAENKFFLFGYLEALKLLSEKYPTTVYLKGWNCEKKNKFQKSEEDNSFLTSDLITYVFSLLVSSPTILDLKAIANATLLLGNLFAGHSISNLKTNYQATLLPEGEDHPQLWNVFKCDRLAALAEEIFTHLLKVLNFYSCLIEEVSLTSTIESSSIAAYTLVPLFSPLKKQEKKSFETDDKKGKSFSAPVQSTHYIKILQLLKSAYASYKVSLDKPLSDKFVDCLEATLYLLSVLLEVSTTSETERCADEILYHMKSVVKLKPVFTVVCVNQLLKSLFGINLASNWEEKKKPTPLRKSLDLFNIIFKLPPEFLSVKIHGRISTNFLECENLNRHHRRSKRKFIPKHADGKRLAVYIRLLEPMVIKSLQLYTTTGNVILQSTVLQLLNQLIQLRLNYCLLDEQQVYLEYVLKQFELIEHGQIPQVELLLPHIFKFLTLLSYEKQHSKPIISVPKILQLCDGLMASNQPVQTHCIPAFAPVVEDLFILRNFTEDKELETQREVLISMLLRVAEFPPIMDLLAKILTEGRFLEDKEKWKRWSKQVMDVALNLASNDRLQIETCEGHYSFINLMSAMSPNVLKPIDPLLKVLFVEPKNSNCCTSLNNWLSRVTAILETILVVKEDTMLNRLEKISPNINLSSFLPSGDFYSLDPFNIDSFLQVYKPSETMARFLFKTLAIVVNRIVESFDASLLLQQKLSIFFICIYHIVKSGTFHRITNSLKNILAKEPDSLKVIFSLFKKLSFLCPLLTCQFSYLLTLLNYCDQIYWKDVLSAPPTLSARLVQWCGVISLADYLCDNLSDKTTLRCLITNNFQEIVLLSHEIPVGELLLMMRQKTSDWSLLMETLYSNKYNSVEPQFTEKLLRLLEATEKRHSVKLLHLLINNYLASPRLALSLLAGSIACRQIEYLLTLPRDRALEEIDEKSFKDLMKFFSNEIRIKRHFSLWSLLNRFGTKIFESELGIQSKPLQTEDFKPIHLEEDWFFDQVKNRCCQRNVSGLEIVNLLNKLNQKNILKIFACQNFNLKILTECLKYSEKKWQKLGVLATEVRDCNEIISNCLFEASKYRILEIISEIRNDLMKFKEKLGSDANEAEILNKISQNDCLHQRIWDVVPSLTILLLREELDIEADYAEDLMEFGFICIGVIAFNDENHKQSDNTLHYSYFGKLKNGFKCCGVILKCPKVKEILSSLPNKIKLQTCINYLYKIICSLIPKFRLSNVKRTEDPEVCSDLTQLHFLSELVMGKFFDGFLPKYLIDSARNLIITICQIPDLNFQILRVPVTGDFQDIVCLSGFIRRFSVFGWANKQQFEEIWVALLSVLGFNSQGDIPVEETGFIVQASAVAVEGITTLLKNTMLDVTKRNLIHHGRDFLSMKSIYESLPLVKAFYKDQGDFTDRNHHFLSNLELSKRDDKHVPGLFSVEYLWTAVKQISSSIDLYEKHSRELSQMGLDLPSCIYFLTELYSQWINQPCPDIKIIISTLKSSLVISDLFTDIAQFQWLLNFSLKIAEIIVPDDNVTLPFVILGSSKAAAIVLPDLETCEKIKKLMLRSNSSPCRMATVQGLLYLLQSYVVCYAINYTGLSTPGSKFQRDEVNFVAFVADTYLPVALHIVQEFMLQVDEMEEEYHYCHWSLIFYLLQNYQSFLGSLKEELNNFILTTLGRRNCSELLMSLLVRGIERLLLTTIIDDAFKDQVSKVALNIISQNLPNTCLYGLQLLMVLSFLDKRAKDIRQLVTGQEDPEKVMKDMEKINILFEKLKKSYPKEAEVVGEVLSYILSDFTASDVLTKVIQEFLSSQQPHQKILGGLLFKVFERAELNLLEDWVVFTLPSFIEGLPVSMSIWVLNCFFLSASNKIWLRSLFPLVQSRIRMTENKDKNLLLVSGISFYNQLKEKSQKISFIEALEKVSKKDSIFIDLLSLLK